MIALNGKGITSNHLFFDDIVDLKNVGKEIENRRRASRFGAVLNRNARD